jgi:hypothetical protein
MSSEKSIGQIETCLDAEVQPEPTEVNHADADKETGPEVPEETAAGSEVSGSEPDADTRRRLNSLDHKRRIQLNRIAAEVEKHGRAVAKIGEAETAIEKAQQDLRNARTELAIHHEQKDAALAHRREHEDKLRAVNDEIRELSLTPAQRKARVAARERERRRAEADRCRAEAEAAELAAKEAYEAELVPFVQTYFRIPGRRRSEPDTWGVIAPHNRSIQVPRRDLPQLEADHQEAVEFFAREARNDLAAEYVSELERNGRPSYFGSKAEQARYLAAWGSDSIRGRAYRARQRERGLSDADPVRLGRPLPGIIVEPSGP